MTDKEKQKEIKNLVAARLAVIPADAILSIGSYGEFTRDQIIKEIEQESEIGKKMIEIQMTYLKKLKEGIFYGNTSHY